MGIEGQRVRGVSREDESWMCWQSTGDERAGEIRRTAAERLAGAEEAAEKQGAANRELAGAEALRFFIKGLVRPG